MDKLTKYWLNQYIDNEAQGWCIRMERAVLLYKLDRIMNYQAMDDISGYYSRAVDYGDMIVANMDISDKTTKIELLTKWDDRLLNCYNACMAMLKGGE